MKLWVVATANNINTDIDLSELCMSEENACAQMASAYQNAVERYFECEVDDNLFENLGEEDEANISDTGFSVYHSRSQNLEFGRICEVEIPDPTPPLSRAAVLAAANLKADDFRSRSRAFAKCLDAMAASDNYVDRGYLMLKAIRDNDLNAFVNAITGWDIEDIMKKAHICRDTDRVFSQEPVDAKFTYYDGSEMRTANCKVDLSNHHVFDIFPDDGYASFFRKGLECGDTIQDPCARVHIGDCSYNCVAKEEMQHSGSEIVFWYGEKEDTHNG